MENLFDRVRGIVIKIGTAGITTLDNGINKDVIDRVARNCRYLVDNGKYVSIVTSGAIACGKGEVVQYAGNHDERFAAIGQPILMQEYRQSFGKYGIKVAQILLTNDNFDSRDKLDFLKRIYYDLVKHHEIPVINENDAIASEEITFGDNDILAAKVTVDLNNTLLMNMTVYDGLLKDGKVVESPLDNYETGYYDDLKNEVRRGGSGGLESKLKSAKICTSNGRICRIGNINKDIIGILKGEVLSTTFYPD